MEGAAQEDPRKDVEWSNKPKPITKKNKKKIVVIDVINWMKIVHYRF